MKFKSMLTATGNSQHYFPVPDEIAEKVYEQFGKRVIIDVGNDIPHHCAIGKSKRIGYYITVGKTTIRKLKLITGETYSISVRKDETEFQFEMPEVLLAVFDTDPEALLLFDKLTPGKKRSIMHHINSAKQEETKINRALKVIENLKGGANTPGELIR